MTRPKSRGRSASYAALCVALAMQGVVRAQAISVTAPAASTINSAAWVGNSASTYGRGINGNSFTSSAISTYNGYQYVAFWQNSSNSGKVAIARRAVGTSSWSVVTLSNTITNGPNDAHNVISMGLDRSDGTIHLAYDMHGHTLRYRVSAANLLTNPSSVTWSTANSATLFPTAERSWLVNSSSVISGVTYPTFITTPSNHLQFAYRNGSSGNGSWFFSDYTSSAWSNTHQIDDGAVGTYNGTVTVGDPNRNNYPNGFTYDANGRLHSVFTWREGATGAANHDLLYVYSDDGGNVWKNNAGTVVANKSTGLKFNLNTPGLIVRPLDESQTLMNQQAQAVDHTNQIHSVGWHRDSAKDPSSTTSTPWEPQESSYFHNWRDDLGNWHETRLPGNVGARPRMVFDANDNAYAIYQVKAGGADLAGGTGSNLYIANGDLVIAAATKASNWTDWKILRAETGPFVSESQVDVERFASDGVLSVMMQSSPTLSGNTGTALKALDYTIAFTPTSTRTFAGADNSSFADAANWSGNVAPSPNTILVVNGDRTARVSTSLTTLDNAIRIGSAGTNGTLDIVEGGTLDLLHAGLLNSQYGGSILVGSDSGAVGNYRQTGGAVSVWRFAVGDYSTTTSGGGVSTATLSGGSLVTNNLDIAFSANGSSPGSSFTNAGGALTVNGDIILGEFGNAATLTLAGGTTTVAGNIREGFNKTNSSTLILDGGELDMTSAKIDVDTLALNSGKLSNVAGFRSGTVVKNTAGVMRFGTNTFTNALLISAGTIRVESNTTPLGSTTATTIDGGVTTGRLDFTGGITLTEPLTLGGRQPTNLEPHIVNAAGDNTVQGTLTMAIGGNQYGLRSDAGTLTVAAILSNSLGSSPTDVRFVNLSGAGDGVWNTILADSSAAGINAAETAVTKADAGTWRFNASNTYTGSTTITGGTLAFSPLTRNVLTNAGGLDIAGGGAEFFYFTGTSPAAQIQTLLSTAYTAGFSGTQIRSSNADAAHGLGWVELADRVRVVYAAYGDATLNGAVDFDDLLAIAQHYGNAGTWADGDFNYDGTVNFDDLLAVAQNYAPGGALNTATFASDWTLAQSLVPEPAVAILALVPTLHRRRRSIGH